MIIEVLALAVIIGIGFVALGVFLSGQLRSFQGERQILQTDLANKQRSIEQLVEGVQRDLKERQQEIRSLEQDRVQKFAELNTSLESHRQLTQELQISTQQLASVLSNNQTRGGWGERILEDLLLAQGLVEGVHYKKQVTQSEGLRPDFMLLLPNERFVPVDVKFPYSEIQKMASAESKQAKDQHVRQFLSDIKIKIRKVAQYIQPEKNTLDYAIMFVPNEMVFSFMNQNFPDVIDDAMNQRVLIVSPFTFLIVARTILESYRNFMIEDKLRDVVTVIADFRQEWLKYSDEFKKFGRALDTLQTSYVTLTTTRTNQLDKKLLKIDEYQTGQLLAGAVHSSASAQVSTPIEQTLPSPSGTGRKTANRGPLPLLD